MATHNPTNLCRLVTLGCKVNQYETQYVKEALEAHGYHESETGEQAELCVVNTCTVTAEGDAKSRQAVRKLHRANPDAKIVVMGCYATRDPETVRKLPGVSKVITDKTRLGEELKEFGVEEMPRNISRFDGHHRAFVKVQDGCLLNCSYCIIPKVRPSLRSREPEVIIEEVTQLVQSGFQEIVLTGIHLGHYGIDLSKGKPKSDWQRLWHLLRRISGIPGNFRIRLSSLEAAEAREDLIRTMVEYTKIVPHLHLCLQSGSDRILRAMKRRYTSGGFLQRCRRIQEALDFPAFTTDVIVGFPGETEEDFAATCRVVREVGFAKIHIFPYSRRADTPAAEFSEQVPSTVIKERRQRLQEMEQVLSAEYQQQLVGRQIEVLAEAEVEDDSGYTVGTSCRYVPVRFPGYFPAIQGRLVPVVVEKNIDGKLLARPISEMQTQQEVPSGRWTPLPVRD